MNRAMDDRYPSREMLATQPQVDTYVELLRYRALHQPDRYAYTFLRDGEQDEVNITYAELDRKVRALASVLQNICQSGERAVLCYPSGLEYVIAFYGCLYAGVIAVPAYPPSTSHHVVRLRSVISDAQASVILTTQTIMAKLQKASRHLPELEQMRWLATTEEEIEGQEHAWQEPSLSGDTIALLQYTSGSTASPKGVMITHQNLLHNNMLEQAMLRLPADATIVCWLPLFHDMGLTLNMIMALYVGARCVLMAPQAFIQKPVRWLLAISRYQAYMSGAPNFAYDLCIQRVTEQQLEGIDLRSLNVVISGAEPVRYATLCQFWEKFAPYGFRWETFCPAYGLAESTVLVSVSLPEEAPRIIYLDREALTDQKIVETSEDDPRAQALVGCGYNGLGQQIAIVDPDTLQECNPGCLGEIWLASPSVSQGYWLRSDATQETFQAYQADGAGPFLRTGDLGFLHAGQLFIASRLKDMIIIRGRNYYPQDVELAVEESHPALRKSGGAAFSIDIDGEEQLVVVQEFYRAPALPEMAAIFQAIRTSVFQQCELHVYAIALIRYNTIPKTSSGKIQRKTCRNQFLLEELAIVDIDVQQEPLETNARAEQIITRELLQVADHEEQQMLLMQYLAAQISATLRVDVQTVQPESRLSVYGLDSLKATMLKGQLENDLQIDIPMITFLEDPSVGRMVRLLQVQLDEQIHGRSESTPFRPHQQSEYYPLSFSQEQIWIFTQLEPESTFYNQPLLIHIHGTPDIEALEWSINEIVRRHEPLCMRFDAVDGTPVQRISVPARVVLSIKYIQSTNETNVNSEVRRLCRQDVMQKFDLAQGPLLRGLLLFIREDTYLLQMVFHHIACDGWSINIFMRELSACYHSHIHQREMIWAELPTSYLDYVFWHRAWLQGERMERQIAYWRQQLHNIKPLMLYTDRSYPALPGYQGDVIPFVFSEELCQGLKQLSRDNGTTLFMTLLATFMLLLARYSGQMDIAVGTLVANRMRKEIEPLIGCFINTLVLRCNCSLDQPFVGLLKRLRQNVLDAYAHQDVPFEKVVEVLHTDRHSGRFPFVNTMLVLQSAPQAVFQEDEVVFELAEGENTATLHDLYISAMETKEGMRCQVRYNTDIFDRSSIERLLGHWKTLVESVILSPEAPLATLSILTQDERQRLLYDWNATRASDPLHFSLGQFFTSQVEAHADEVAASYGDAALTYAELDHLSNQLSHVLHAQGVGPDVLVGIYMERSLAMLICILAVFKAGGAYLPLEPAYPVQRLGYILNEARPRLILTRQQMREQMQVLSREWLHGQCPVMMDLDDSWQMLTYCAQQAPSVLSNPDNLAYVIYTSGSTGTPKGVMVVQRGMINHLLAKIDALRLRPGDRIAQTASHCFDISVWQFLSALFVGGRVHIIPDEIVHHPTSLVREMIEQHITIIETVPSSLHALVNDLSDRQEQVLPELDLRWMLVTGEICSTFLARRWEQLYAQIPIMDVYGPTECSDDVTHAQLVYPISMQRVSVPIGKPIINTQVYILDKHLSPVPIGVSGEIYIGGVGLGRGYLSDPVRTALAMIPHPFANEKGSRLYRTGDIGRYLPDGQIEFLGRKDDQVKVRGYRIELSEIEVVLREHASVKDCATTVCSLTTALGKNDFLIAYIVLRADHDMQRSALRQHILQKLPEYMCPTQFISLEEIPLTANGKVDRQALPIPGSLGTVLQKDRVAPRNETEQIIADIWQRVLGLQQISVLDNFFELGGYSLLSAQVLARIREHMGRELPLKRLFEFPTIAELAKFIQER